MFILNIYFFVHFVIKISLGNFVFEGEYDRCLESLDRVYDRCLESLDREYDRCLESLEREYDRCLES